MLRIFFIALALFLPASAETAQAQPGWPEVIDRLATARTQAVVCVGLLKSGGDATAIQQGKATYGLAKAQSDGAIAGLLTLLLEGGQPRNLPKTQDQIAAAGAALQHICDAATQNAKPGEKGVWDDLAKSSVAPLIKALSDGIAGLWTHHVEKDRLEIEGKKTQLEAARWPDFSSIAAP